jgi:hypothetical protein
MNKKLFEHTKLNLERTIQNLTAQDSEFVYTDNNGTVPANKNYSMYYLTDKRELYFTGLITSKYVRQLTRIKNPTLYSQYTNIKGSSRENYPLNSIPDITEKDYNTGSITRYFVQKANNINASVYETSESDFNKNLTLYNKTSFSWVILGIKEDVIRQNTITIRNKERNFKGINKILFPLQYWRPSKDVPVTLEKKLSLLKTN